MRFSRDLFDQSVERTARMVALELLDKAAKERKRLDDPEDVEALHDFRVAVRRLRTWLRALEPSLRDSTSKKAKRRLKRAAHLSGEARDAEVHHEWLEKQQQRHANRRRQDHARITEQLADEKAKSRDDVDTAAAPSFDRAQVTLARALRSYRVDIEDAKADAPRSFASEMAELIRSHGAQLSEHLAQVRSFKDAKKGHEARIAGKRLRYLIEVVAGCVSGGDQLVADLGELQDLLGDWHDADVFAANIAARGGDDPSAGLRALTKSLARRGRKAFASVKEQWCDPRAFAPRVAAIVEELSSRGGGPKEIERKYLLAKLPELPDDSPMVEIEQGYLPGGRLEERLRQLRMAGDERRYLRTLKSGDGLTRMEIEEAIPKTLFKRMWPLTRGRRLRKRRYTVPNDGHSWEVDEFLDRDLVLAEVELESADEEVELPSWLAAVVVRDVTSESAYSNSSLASSDRVSGRKRRSKRR